MEAPDLLVTEEGVRHPHLGGVRHRQVADLVWKVQSKKKRSLQDVLGFFDLPVQHSRKHEAILDMSKCMQVLYVSSYWHIPPDKTVISGVSLWCVVFLDFLYHVASCLTYYQLQIINNKTLQKSGLVCIFLHHTHESHEFPTSLLQVQRKCRVCYKSGMSRREQGYVPSTFGRAHVPMHNFQKSLTARG